MITIVGSRSTKLSRQIYTILMCTSALFFFFYYHIHRFVDSIYLLAHSNICQIPEIFENACQPRRLAPNFICIKIKMIKIRDGKCKAGKV